MFWLRIILCSVFNRARGSHVFNLVPSTEGGRIIATLGMALTLLPDLWEVCVTFLLLMLWCTPAWDKFWAEEIGHSSTHSRLYGLMQMTVRQCLIVPCYLTLAYLNGTNPIWAMMFLTLGLPYYIMGYTKSPYQIGISEYAVGAIIGFTVGMLYVG